MHVPRCMESVRFPQKFWNQNALFTMLIVKLCGALIWLLYMVDTFGRRGVLFIGSIGGSISMYYIAAYIAIAQPAEHPTTKLSAGGQSASELLGPSSHEISSRGIALR